MRHAKRVSRIALGVFHLLIGLGALGGGFGAIMDPSGGAMGISTEVLRNAPFDNFLIPGLFLFIVIGVGNVCAAVTAFRGYAFQGYVTGALSVIMVLWIGVQVYMLWEYNYLHVVYLFVGIGGTAWAGIILARRRLFPFSLFCPWRYVSDV